MRTSIFKISLFAFTCLFLSRQIDAQNICPYINGGVAIPVGISTHSPDPQLTKWFTSQNIDRTDELLASGGGAKTGFSVEAGVLIPIHQVGQELLIDLMAGLDMTQMDSDWTDIHPASWGKMVYMSTKPHHLFGFKLGTAATYRIDPDLTIGFAYSLHPTLATNAEWKHAYSYGGNYWLDELVFNRGFGIRHAFEAKVQLRLLQLGVEADLGRIVFKEPTFYDYFMNDKDDLSPAQNSEHPFSVTTSNNMLKIKLGVIIGN